MTDRAVQVFNKALISAGDMSSSISPATLYCSDANLICVQFSWTGTSPVGTAVVAISNDNVIYTPVSSQAVSGNSGSLRFTEPCSYPFIQVSYTSVSGTGTLLCTVNGKVA